ncbi:DUF952 domain-containing protein [Hymenobacter lucidus]|uniref:DUF952 domain-containing protein n=1 Tax=Hymenobacter lucidus TaxID=2880930 RepID=A0ABS8AS12_9BACT|nr:DUF952 domain-containing protein [Hymenobacter lucidus]MCB2409000.1 DUF952 domain-containing protein [Hymenobacter lucidus]
MSSLPRIYRIADPADWKSAQQTGFFASADLAAEGFIHCSEKHQILETARRYYAGCPEVLLLEIAEDRLTEAGVRVEREWMAARNEAFAHVFGPIPQAAILRVLAFTASSNGQFELPAELHEG